jgi:hypothetical protein
VRLLALGVLILDFLLKKRDVVMVQRELISPVVVRRTPFGVVGLGDVVGLGCVSSTLIILP